MSGQGAVPPIINPAAGAAGPAGAGVVQPAVPAAGAAVPPPAGAAVPPVPPPVPPAGAAAAAGPAGPAVPPAVPAATAPARGRLGRAYNRFSSTGQAIGRGSRSLANTVGRVGNVASRSLERATASPRAAIANTARQMWEATSSARAAIKGTAQNVARGIKADSEAAGRAIVKGLDVTNDGLPVDIMGDRYFLDMSYKGAADIGTRDSFMKLYGLRDGVSDVTINTIYKVFRAPAPFKDAETKAKLVGFNRPELEKLRDAIQTRITTLGATIKTLVNGTVIQEVAKYKLMRMEQLLSWINDVIALRASGVGPEPSTAPLNYRRYFKELRDDKLDISGNRKHAHIFDAIMATAYYLANPDYLIDSSDVSSSDPLLANKQAIIDRFEGVLELLDKGHIHDLVASIQRDADLPRDLSGVDAMNFFDRIRLKGVLSKSTDTDASNEILSQIKMPTMDEVMSNRVISIMKLLHAQKYIDASAIEGVEQAVRDKNTIKLMDDLGEIITEISGGLVGVNAKTKELLEELYDAFTPVHNFYRATYNPIFDFIKSEVVRDRDWPLDDMTSILQLGLEKYKKSELSANFGVYKLEGIDNGVNDFIKELQTATRFSDTTKMRPEVLSAFSSLPTETVQDRTGSRDASDTLRGFVGKTPNVLYMLRNQFNVPQTLDDDDLQRRMEDYKSMAKKNNSKKKENNAAAAAAKAANAAKKRKAAANAAAAAAAAGPQTGGSAESFADLTNFFGSSGLYMVVNHRKEDRNFNPRIIDMSNNRVDITPAGLKEYASLKQSDVITLPKATYIRINIVILAISCMIIFYNRLKKAAGK